MDVSPQEPVATEGGLAHSEPGSDRQHAQAVVSLDQRALNRSLRAIALWVIGLLFAAWIVQANRNFIVMLVVAWLCAIAMDPTIDRLVGRGWQRNRATGLVLSGVVLATAAFIAAFGGVLFSQAASLIASLPSIITDIVNQINTTFSLTLDPNTIISNLNISPAQIAMWASNFAGGIVGILSTTIGALFQILTTLLFCYYFAAEGPRVRRVIGGWLNPHAQRVFVTTWDIAVQKAGGFVASKALMAAISATMHATFFAVIGVPYWLPMGLITGLVSQFIPTVGTYLGILIPLIIGFIHEPVLGLYILIFATIYQQFENYVVSPRISRITMDVHPAIAFGSVILFANLFGPIGAVFSIPLAAVFVSVVDTYGHRNELIPELLTPNSSGIAFD